MLLRLFAPSLLADAQLVTAGDGFLAAFGGPGRAVRCASAAVRAVRSPGIEIRAGLHTGEAEVAGDDRGAHELKRRARPTAGLKADG